MKKAITVIAALVAVLAVTSGAFAAKQYVITSSKQIKHGTIRLSDLSRHARKLLHGHVGHVGPQGLKGDPGATGPHGPQGPQGLQGALGKDGTNGKDGKDGLTGVLASFGGTLNDGYSGWRMSGSYDAQMVTDNYLQISDATTSGSFGDWLFSPKVADAKTEFQAAFDIMAAPGARNTPTDAGQWNHISVSPDDGNGGRMSYLRFENRSDGIHVFFDDVTDSGPKGTVADFNETDIATLDPSVEHVVQFDLDLTANQVKVYIDGKLDATGTTWKNYYRYDPDQAPANTVPVTNSLIFQARGTQDAADLGKGFLISSVRLASS